MSTSLNSIIKNKYIKQYNKYFTIKLYLVFFLFLTFFAVIVGVVVNYKVINAENIIKVADEYRSAKNILFAKRGDIVDSNNITLATTEKRYSISADPIYIKTFNKYCVLEGEEKGNNCIKDSDDNPILKIGAEAIAPILSPIINISEEELIPKLELDTHYSPLLKYATKDIKRSLEDSKISPYFSISETHIRTYPNPEIAGTMLGVISSESLNKNEEKPMEGITGIEKMANYDLSGGENMQGYIQYQRGGNGEQIPTAPIKTVEPVDGNKVKLTINSHIQMKAQEIIERKKEEQNADWGVIVIQEVKTGKLVAVAQTDEAMGGTDEAFLKKPIAFTTSFEPGSTCKAITAATLIDRGLAAPTTPYTVSYNYTDENGNEYHDAVETLPNHITLAGVLAYSSNVGTMKAAAGIPFSQRKEIFRNFRFGTTTGLDFPEEATSLIFSDDHDTRSFQTILFGQAITATAIHSVSGFQALANNGVQITPSLIDGHYLADGIYEEYKDYSGKVIERQVIAAHAAQETVSMLESGIHYGVYRTGAVPNYRVAAKSGTAQMDYDPKIRDYTGKMGSFVGIVPADNPEYVIGVFLKNFRNSRFAGTPIGAGFSEIAEFTLETYSTPFSTPKTDYYPITW
ncbi:MAG: penicillin-binding protein 2 [Bifidobacteriaceae bacterium]|jgi:cell division protein FtsI (penicillin-binding protein 3)|nr:penicillin-binding protein 2 [Bifidobacteriaceae bacterium]